MTSRIRRARGVAAVAVVAVASFGVALYGASGPVHAVETSVEIRTTCTLDGVVPVRFTVDHEPETTLAGEPFTIHLRTDFRLAEGTPELPLRSLDLTIPVPAGVTVGVVGVSGGTFTEVGQDTFGGNVMVHLTAVPGTTTASLRVPDLAIAARIAEGWAGATVTFRAPTNLAVGLDVAGTPVTDSCYATADSPPLLTVRVAAPAPPGSLPDGEEMTVQTTAMCSITGSWPVVYHVGHQPGTAAAGEPYTLRVRTTLGLSPGTPDVPITSLTLVFPPPTGGAAIGNISVTGGTFTKLSQISQETDGSATRLNLVANPGLTASAIAVPDLDIPVQIPPDAGGGTVTVASPSTLNIGFLLGGSANQEGCSAAGYPPLATIAVPSTSPTTSTTSSTTTSTTRPGHAHPGTRPNPSEHHGGGSGHPRPEPPGGGHDRLLALLERILCDVFTLC
jgi:hypothetical protein